MDCLSYCSLYVLQLLDTLPVCQDFNRQGCTRPTCRFVHIREGNILIYQMSLLFCSHINFPFNIVNLIHL